MFQYYVWNNNNANTSGWLCKHCLKMFEVTEIMAAILFKTSYFQFTNVVFAQSQKFALYVFVQIGFMICLLYH